MKKKFIQILLILILQVICSLFNFAFANGQSIFCVSDSYSDLFENAAGLNVGDQLPQMTLNDFARKRIDLSTIQTKILITYQFSTSPNQSIFDLYEKWAERWKGDLQIVLIFKDAISESLAKRFQQAGIVVASKCTQADKYFKQFYKQYIYMVDENKLIAQKLPISAHKWKQIQLSIDEFVQKKEQSQNIYDTYGVKPGEKVRAFHAMKGLDGKQYSLDDFKGKPTVFVLSPTDAIIPTLQEVKRAYGEKVNIVVEVSYFSQQYIEGIKSFFEYLNLEPTNPARYNNFVVSDPFADIEKYGELNDFTFLLNEFDEIRDVWNSFGSDTIVVVDAELTVVDTLMATWATFANQDDAANAVLPRDELFRIIQPLCD